MMEETSFKDQLKTQHQKSHSKQEIKRFKRPSKHAPKEISSKIPAAKMKKIKFFTGEEDPTNEKSHKKVKPRDPRFEKYSGNFNQGLFEASYSFLDEYREQELKEIEEALENNEFPEKSRELRKIYLKKKQEIQKIKDQKRELKVKRSLAKDEKEKVKQGKKPYFVKKGTIKMLAQQEKIAELKESGQYQEYSRKKRKREITNERSELFSIPSTRRSE